MEVRSLLGESSRRRTANVAGPGGLLVAKLHKLGERQAAAPHRLNDKDAHDVYRLLVAVPTQTVAATIGRLLVDPLAGPVTAQALVHLRELFAAGPAALGSAMAGRAEEGIGEPATVSAATAVLAEDVLAAVRT